MSGTQTRPCVNHEKHDLSFDEAKALFQAETALDIYDGQYDGEDRSITIDPIDRGIIVVVWTDRAVAIRLISARFATRKEQHLYRSHICEN